MVLQHGVIFNVADVSYTPELLSPTVIGIVAVGTGTLTTSIPTLITRGNADALIGTMGELRQAYDMVVRQSTPVVVCVHHVDDADLEAAINSLEEAEILTGYKPTIIIAPKETYVALDDGGASDVVGWLNNVANHLRAYVPADAAVSTAVIAGEWNTANGSNRIQGVVPQVNALQVVSGSGAALLAGTMARNDAIRGVHSSPGNLSIPRFTYPAGSLIMGYPWEDIASNAALLDAQNIMSFVNRRGAAYTWGGTTTYTPADDDRRFVGVGRQVDKIHGLITQVGLDLVDRGITRDFISKLISLGQGILNGMKSRGEIIYALVKPDPLNNTIANLANGRIYVDIEMTPVYPARVITFNLGLSIAGLEGLIGG